MKRYLLVLTLLPYLLFSQAIITEENSLENKEIKLPGTLSYPKTETKIPLVIYVHGSGNVDRNGNQPGTFVKANYIKILADSLNAKGIAFYRYDKRTATPANFEKLSGITLTDFVNDAKIAINYYQNDDRFHSIHLIGHSQGSLVAMLAVTNAVATYTSIAGPATSIDNTLIKQVSSQNEDLGQVASAHFEELKKTDTILAVNPFLLQVFAPQNQKFIANWLTFDPSIEIQKLKIPILILQGDADVQVNVQEAENLKKAKPDAKMQIIRKMNHFLKEVNSLEENNKSYSDETYPLSSELVTNLTNFILSI